MSERAYTFIGGTTGPWQVRSIQAITGDPLPPAARLELRNGQNEAPPTSACWVLHGAVSHERYVTRSERARLGAKQPPLGRPDAVYTALIPIRKSVAWWALAQDERRALLEERSRHIEIGLDYLPAIARRLYHARDLGGPFDFLTWFEHAPEHASVFDELLARLRGTEEWKYVEREVEVRLILDPSR